MLNCSLNGGASDCGAAERWHSGRAIRIQHDVVAAGAGVLEVGCVKRTHDQPSSKRLIDPASKVSLPLTVVMRTWVRVAPKADSPAL